MWLKELTFVIIVWVRDICCQIFQVTAPATHRTDSSPTLSNSPGVCTVNEAQALSYRSQVTLLNAAVVSVFSVCRMGLYEWKEQC